MVSAFITSDSKDRQIQHLAIVGGIIDTDNNTIKQSVLKTNQIADSLRKNKRVTQIKIQDLPVDTRPESTIEDLIDNRSPSTTHNRGNFQIQLLMKGREI